MNLRWQGELKEKMCISALYRAAGAIEGRLKLAWGALVAEEHYG